MATATTDTAEPAEPAVEGLRARKLAHAKLAVERAALTLALERGYEHATVDAICEAAEISQRTFFNYFGSKDGVFFRTPPTALNAEDEERFIHGTGSLVGDLITAITNAMVDHEVDPELFALRRKLAKTSPEFAETMLARMNSVEEAHVALIRKRFAAQHRQGSETELDDEAHMIVALSIGAMNFVARRWFEGGFEQTPQTLLRHAIRLVRRVTSD